MVDIIGCVSSPLIVGLISGLITTIVYIVHAKSRGTKTENKEILKMGLLGILLGIFNSLLLMFFYKEKILSNTNTGVESLGNEEIFTGNPDF